jgi:phosphopentomutase
MRFIILVIDSFGIGATEDAFLYGDTGANTALHICNAIKTPNWVNLQKMGLGNAGKLLGFELPGCESVETPSASYGVMYGKSPGKDTTTGHWEIAGIILEKPFAVYNKPFPAFPDELIKKFETKIEKKILGNKAASGTEIIQDLGDEHIKTGYPIVYTSADSVLQIAAHEDIIPIENLYNICSEARKICDMESPGLLPDHLLVFPAIISELPEDMIIR